MMVSDGLIEQVNIRHTGNIIDLVIEATESMLFEAPKVAGVINDWKTIDLSQPQQKLLAESAHSLRFDEGTPSPAPEKLLTVRRYDDNGSDLWTVFNRIQENTVRGGLRTMTQAHRDDEGRYHPARRGRTREVVGIDQNTKLNRALWSLAEKMAELKHPA
jgi:hypothetical protein